MTTPNQAGSKHPSYAQHAVSTPITHLHTPSISTPRSMPSPALHRSGASKHPLSANPQVVAKTHQGGAAMSTSLSQISNTSNNSATGAVGLGVMGTGMLGIGVSPSTHLLAFTSPAGLTGLDMSTPSALLDGGVSGAPSMNLSLSDLGIHSGRRNEDEERRIKIGSVMGKLLGKRKRDRGDRFGRISEEGVRRVGRWAGLDVDVDSKWESKEFEGRRPVVIAGKNAVMVEFAFNNNLATKIDVSFVSDDKDVTAHQAAAASVLLQDLTPPPGVAAINTKLDRFASNLQTLARLDKLSVADQLNCFEAITGVYTSLRKLYEHEKKAAVGGLEENPGDLHLRAEREVICKNSGRPRMHARQKIGLSLDYWMNKRNITAGSTPRDDGAMDVDSASSPRDGNEESVYSLELTVESSSPELYPALRVSSKWVGDRILIPSSETMSPSALLSGGPSIDWQDPPSSYLPADDQHADAMSIDGGQGARQQKLPGARFVAKLHPPLVMPWNVANQILQSVGSAPSTDTNPLGTYVTTLLEQSNVSSTPAVGTGPAATSITTVATPSGDMKHENALFVPKQDFVYNLREIPFAHPRQIIGVLPTLRQWACYGSLVRDTFVTSAPELGQTSSLGNGLKDAVIAEQRQLSLDEILAASISSEEREETRSSDANQMLPMDMSLSTLATPGFDLIFPLHSKEVDLASLNVKVLADAEIVVTGQNLVGSANAGPADKAENQEEEEETTRKVREMGRALEIAGDVGTWIEWLKTQYGRRTGA
ncbi:hypothetical protein MBLNU459_g0677t2 [Dothideomycetes sp. NU459]